jgi:hypothetical protein
MSIASITDITGRIASVIISRKEVMQLESFQAIKGRNPQQPLSNLIHNTDGTLKNAHHVQFMTLRPNRYGSLSHAISIFCGK